MAGIFSWLPFTKIFQAVMILKKKTMTHKGWHLGLEGEVGLFSLHIYRENRKNLLVRNHSTDFNIILQKCYCGDPLPICLSQLDRQGVGDSFPMCL